MRIKLPVRTGRKIRRLHPKIHDRRLSQFLAALPTEARDLLLGCRLTFIEDELFIYPNTWDELGGNEARCMRRKFLAGVKEINLSFITIWLQSSDIRRYRVRDANDEYDMWYCPQDVFLSEKNKAE